MHRSHRFLFMIVVYIKLITFTTNCRNVGSASKQTSANSDRLLRCVKSIPFGVSSDITEREKYLLIMLIIVFWIIILHNPLGCYQCFRGIHHVHLPWASWIQSTLTQSTVLRSVLITSSYLCWGLPKLSLPLMFHKKYTFLMSSMLSTLFPF